MRVETRLARNASSEAELEWMGRSTVEYCRWVLAQKLTDNQHPFDSLQQTWATGSGPSGNTNSPPVDNPVKFVHGNASWKIIDLERYININTVSEASLQQALMSMGVDAGEMTPVVNWILDWTHPGTSPRARRGPKTIITKVFNHRILRRTGR